MPPAGDGRVVAISGGARGIGRATAAALLNAGFRVAIGDLDPDLTQLVARELGRDCIGLGLDVTDTGSFAAFLDEVDSHFGRLDVLVNNAGVMTLATVAAESEQAMNRMLDVNIGGVITGSRLAIAHMRPTGSGHIVNVASILGKAALPGAATYCATKHAVIGLSESLRAELATTNLQVSVVMPGLANTELGAGVRSVRGVGIIQPEDVAAAIVAAVERPRFEVFVPRTAGVMLKVMAFVPRCAREWLARRLRSDRVFVDIDAAARAAYDDRVTHDRSAA